LPHAKNEGAWAGRQGDWLVAGTDALPEWLHSDYVNRKQLPVLPHAGDTRASAITAVLGVRVKERISIRLWLGIFHAAYAESVSHRLECDGSADRDDCGSGKDRLRFLQSQTARVSIPSIDLVADRLQVQVLVENLTGHKMPTAYPSRRAWLHVTVRDTHDNKIF